MLKLNNEIKTGVVVVVAALVFMYIFTAMGAGGKKSPTDYKLNVVFNYVSGLEDKSPVKLAGVEVGEVEKVVHSYTDDQTKVMVTLNLRGDAKVREDSKVKISTTGLIGEKYIEITGGSKGSPFVAKGSTLEGIDLFEMDELIGRLDSAMRDLQKLMGHADDLLVDNKDDIRATIMNLKDSSENLKEFSDDVKRNPWKLLMKGKDAKKDDVVKDKRK
ncbi:MAG: MlaD family protein [Candidatus Omnitrophota bacterium]|jgi:phospholipid/cholesterol/gamma-HCH transport system substrate-binding protein